MYKKLVLIICLLFSIDSAFAYNVFLVKQASSQSGSNKPFEEPPIRASINGNVFSATFIENLGSVNVSIATIEGDGVFEQNILCTPNGIGCHLPNAGDYIVTFTLSNGDEYYGEFTVTE